MGGWQNPNTLLIPNLWNIYFQKQIMILQPPRRLPAGKREYIVTLAREEFQRSSECLHMDPAHIKGPAVWVFTFGPSPCIAAWTILLSPTLSKFAAKETLPRTCECLHLDPAHRKGLQFEGVYILTQPDNCIFHQPSSPSLTRWSLDGRSISGLPCVNSSGKWK